MELKIVVSHLAWRNQIGVVLLWFRVEYAADMEQYSRRECVDIQGIPVSEREDTNKIVVRVGELIGVDLNISYIWTSNGRIYLRKSQDSPVIPINNKDDLKKLYPSQG